MDREERAQELESMISSAVEGLEAQMANGTSEDFIRSLEWWSSFRGYSWNNSMLILFQRPDAIQMAGFRAWEKLGYHVRKGEKATWLRGPMFKKLPDPDTGELVERLVGYIPLCVFDIAQCVEFPDKQPPSPYKPETTADWEHLYECWCRRLATTYSISVKEAEMGALTFGMASLQAIRINRRSEISIKAMTLLHEVAHIAAGHPTADAFAKWTRQERELQVEAASYVLCRMLGAHHPNAANYLVHYKVAEGQLQAHLETIGKIVRDVRAMLDFKHLAREEGTVEEVSAA